jgi:UDP-N-acetylglucosamine--N-acetylmuramyl-(pentapeptide) pyrophosphoryl-undecaprenol N-acetylglucosamine transferase
MTKLATKITLSLDESKKDFPADKVVVTSNPSRKDLFLGNKENGQKRFNLDPSIPIILIYGGGQGAVKINEMILKKIDLLTEKYQIIHLTGVGKKISARFPARFEGEQLKKINLRYRDFEFLNEEIFDAYAVADLVVSRSGFSSLTELSVLGKAALVIPLKGHQELNAHYFAKQNAVRVLSQENLNESTLFQTIDSMMQNPSDLENLSRNISQIIDKDAAKKYVEVINEVVNVKKEQ